MRNAVIYLLKHFVLSGYTYGAIKKESLAEVGMSA